MRYHPGPYAQVPVSDEIYKQLRNASCNTFFQKEDWEIAEEAIDEWTRRHDPDAVSVGAYSGYQWKQLFLPSGTVLRTVFGGKNHHCMVEGDRILYQEKPVSPSVFVNAVGGIRRNAWRCTWILFPDTKHWALADTLRPRDRKRPRAAPPAVPAREAVAPAASTLAVTTPAASTPAADTPAASTPASASAQGGTVPRATGMPERRACGQHPIAASLRLQLRPLLDRLFELGGLAAAGAVPVT